MGKHSWQRPVRPAKAVPPASLKQSHFKPGRLADHFSAPGWIPHQVDLYFVDPGYGQQFAAGFIGDHGAHAATRSGKRHFHVDAGKIFARHQNLAAIYQAQVDDVAGSFRIVRTDEHTSELQSLMRTACAASSLVKTTTNERNTT